MKCIFSVDVEDWFHILDLPSTPNIIEWDSLPSHVEKNFRKILIILSEKNAHATFFFLGWVAQKFPHLVTEAQAAGHEIGSHGYSHKLTYEMSPAEFLQDAIRSKAILEGITGQPIIGYRSAGFSVTEDTPWFYEKLIEAGYQYDSSVFPMARGHGGIELTKYAPFSVLVGAKQIMEFPITVIRLLGKKLCLFGGGYLRLSPYFLIKWATKAVLKEGRPVIFYVHPREVDPHHPRLPMNFFRRFKSYINLSSTEAKIRKILNDFDVISFEECLTMNKAP